MGAEKLSPGAAGARSTLRKSQSNLPLGFTERQLPGRLGSLAALLAKLREGGKGSPAGFVPAGRVVTGLSSR
eukprot:COSAG06_NODE_124_length_22969_cov_136.895310_4_plen_72_part_00